MARPAAHRAPELHALVGALDWITLAIDLLLFGTLVAARKQFLGARGDL